MPLDLSAIGKKIGPVTTKYGWKDVVLYAVGVGAGFDELDYVYENRLKVIPSFAVPSVTEFFSQVVALSGVDLAGILHGEHKLILHNPIPPEGGELTTEGAIIHYYDKGAGKGALVVAEATTCFSDGRRLFTNILTIFSRLDGGFGGEDAPKERIQFPDRPPDFEEPARPSADQPLVYRLSGDTFALHVDPEFARLSGFERPIMHGLCTHGFACRAVIKHLFPGEPERLTLFKNRFTKALYPGTPITTQIWRLDKGRAVFRTLNAETGEAVIDRGLVEWIGREEAEKRHTKAEIRLDGRVAIVTGGGGGLGRAYALELARRGARVVVNDLGGGPDGTGGSKGPADRVVKEIEEIGGEAIASYASVTTAEGGEEIVRAALEKWGQVDILINNAGILRDKTFAKMTGEMWEKVREVHLDGAYHVTGPAFRAMKERGYGRIVLTTSAAGLYGNFGQANYSAAKMGLVGLMNTLKLEGEKSGIKVNTVAPLAVTRLTEELLPDEMRGALKPEAVAPLVIYLCSEECPASGGVYSAGMGHFSRAAILTGPGAVLAEKDRLPTAEEVAANWAKIISLAGGREYHDANAALGGMLAGPPEKATPGAPKAAAGDGNAAQVFERMSERFDARAATGVEAVFQFSISGAGGGEWHAVVKNGACQIGQGKHAKPTTTLKMADEDFLAMVGGKLPPMKAYTSGKLKIEGDLMKSQLVQKLWRL